MEANGVSISRECRVVELHRSVYYYKSKRSDAAVIDKLQEMVEARPTEGFWKLYGCVRIRAILGITSVTNASTSSWA